MRLKLLATAAVLVALSGCTSHGGASTAPPTSTSPITVPDGTISGHLYWVGGPQPGAHHPLSGSISGRGAGKFTVTVGSDGSFTVIAPAGRYALIGRSPSYNGGAGTCHATSPVIITSGQSTTADVFCQVR